MRLHRLEIRAFGPFAAPAVVDFDALGRGGLFLLTGATGAGKTSVLDAVAFALYGDVPGDRAGSGSLRSDRAEEGLEPRVTLELTLAGRRFRVSRTPAWDRPKKRGTGLTRAHASVSLLERVDGDWTTLTTRIDEAGHLLGDLLGMTLTQFAQVVMLPQGHFQAFLRASSAERHGLLQRLFRTSEHEQVERWLKERRREVRRSTDLLAADLAGAVARTAEVAAVPPPRDDEDTSPAPGQGSPAVWAHGLARASTQSHTDARTRLTEVAARHEQAHTALQTGHTTAATRARGVRARARLAELDREWDQHRAQERALTQARAAAPLADLVASTDTAADQHQRSQDALTRLRTDWTGVLPDSPGEHLDGLQQARRALDAAIDLTHEHTRHRRDEAAAAADVEVSTGALARLEADAEELPVRARATRERLDRAREAAGRLTELAAQADDLQRRHTAGVTAETTQLELDLARDTAREHHTHRQQLREDWLDLRERRINGMAAELAGDLAAGCACPVCGSGHHPRPAVTEDGAVSRDDEREARRQLDDAEAAAVALDARVAELTAERSRLLERRGEQDLAALAAALERTRGEQEQLRPVAAAATEAERAVQETEKARASLAETLVAAREHLAEARTGLALAQERVRTTSERLGEQLAKVVALVPTTAADDLVPGLVPGPADDAGVPDAGRLQRSADLVQRRVDALAALVSATERELRARDRHAELAALLQASLAPTGLDTVDQVRAALLDDEALARLDAEVTARAADRAAALAVLADADVAAALEHPTPDLAALETSAAELDEQLGAARTEVSVTGQRADRLTELAAEIDHLLQRWQPAEAELRLVTDLSRLVDGTSGENRWQMRLSAYVLARRFSAVVAAANERLARMSDGRYLLEHSAVRGVGENRGGLSLQVHDAWSGVARDPATLSGGESFVVALALALGLADVITQEAGGQSLETLFVDEGFGALDADTLDDVLDTLDQLREGGRVVGLVSHVPQLQERISTRLHVEKQRDGSRVRLVAG